MFGQSFVKVESFLDKRREPMRNKDNPKYILAMIWKVLLLIVGFWGLLDGAGITKGQYTPNFPHMFTNVSNLFGWGYFALALIFMIRHRHEEEWQIFAPTAKYTATISLLVTMIIGHVMLFGALVQDGHIVWHLIVLHYIVPVMSLLDWLFFDPKGRMPVWGPLAWLSLVLAYLVFTMIAVGVFGIYMGGGTTADLTDYPYTFLDPGIVGVGGVVRFCGAMLVLFIILGYVLYGIDHLLGKYRQKSGTAVP